MTYAVKMQSFMAIRFFLVQEEAFQFSKFHEPVVELGKGNFKRGLTVTFKTRSLQNNWKNWLKILQAYFLWAIKQTAFLKFSKIEKFIY